MTAQIDSGTFLYAVGIAFVLGALIVFARDVLFGLSITVKAVLLFALVVVLFTSGLAITGDLLDVVAFTLAALAYTVLIGYLLSVFAVSPAGLFGLLAMSGLGFVLFGYLHRERALSVSTRTAGLVLGVCLMISAGLVGMDVTGSEVAYTTTLNETPSITIADGSADPPEGPRTVTTTVGTVTATNDFVFTRQLDLPRIDGCVVGSEAVRNVHVDYRTPRYERPNTIAGGDSQTFVLEATLRVAPNASAPRTITVDRGADCADSRDEPTLLVAVGQDN